MRDIAFQKWEATGNDFFFVDAEAENLTLEDFSYDLVQSLCQRGPQNKRGADGLVLFRLASADQPATMDILNSDGSLAGMCGNALRCLAKILAQQTGIPKQKVQLSEREVSVCAIDPENPKVYMGQPSSLNCLLYTSPSPRDRG